MVGGVVDSVCVCVFNNERHTVHARVETEKSDRVANRESRERAYEGTEHLASS